MLSRRSIRVKVMQSLYTFEQDPDISFSILEKNLTKNIEASYKAYSYNLLLISKIAEYSCKDAAIKASKLLPSEKDLQVSTKIFHNPVIQSLIQNKTFKEYIEKEKLHLISDQDLIMQLYKELVKDKTYQEYCSLAEGEISKEKHVVLVLNLYNKIMLKNDLFYQHLEDVFPSWIDDKEQVAKAVQESIQSIKQEASLNLLSIKDFSEETAFAKDLLKLAIEHNQIFVDLISPKVQNWEVDRIAKIDMILMKMALTEMLYFTYVPIKVSINEYIDISKIYSTPKSKDFINGIMDKMMKELKEDGKIVKMGRGLQE